MLMRFDPFRDVDRVAQALAQSSGTRPGGVMSMDAYRDGDEFVVHFDVPGVDPATLDLTIEKNVLTVTAERRWVADEDQEVVVSERPQGTFTRQLFLGDSLDPDGMDASCQDGVLTLRIPVSEQAKPRKVEVSSSGGRQTIDATASETGEE